MGPRRAESEKMERRAGVVFRECKIGRSAGREGEKGTARPPVGAATAGVCASSGLECKPRWRAAGVHNTQGVCAKKEREKETTYCHSFMRYLSQAAAIGKAAGSAWQCVSHSIALAACAAARSGARMTVPPIIAGARRDAPRVDMVIRPAAAAPPAGPPAARVAISSPRAAEAAARRARSPQALHIRAPQADRRHMGVSAVPQVPHRAASPAPRRTDEEVVVVVVAAPEEAEDEGAPPYAASKYHSGAAASAARQGWDLRRREGRLTCARRREERG